MTDYYKGFFLLFYHEVDVWIFSGKCKLAVVLQYFNINVSWFEQLSLTSSNFYLLPFLQRKGGKLEAVFC